ncbi:MAG: hypothetical protein RIT45_1499 [Pseudomonadota bacterium]
MFGTTLHRRIAGQLAAVGLCGAMALAAAGCGTTPEAQMSRFKDNKVKVEALVARRPDLKDAIAKQSSDFQKEYDEIVAAGGDFSQPLVQLNRRMRTYIETIDPTQKARPASTAKMNRANAAPPPGTAVPTGGAPMNAGMGTGGKLGGAPTAAPGAIPPPPAGAAPIGKLGGSPTAAPGAIPPPPAGAGATGKLGGGPTAAPGAMGAPTAPAPTGKLGGAPTAAPAGTGAPGGMGAPAVPAPTGKLGGTP